MGLCTINSVVCAQRTSDVKRSAPEIMKKKTRYCVGQMMIETARDLESHRHITYFSGLKKQSARWVPCWLIIGNKSNRVINLKHYLALFNHNPMFLIRFITVDGIWIYHNTPQNKQRLKQWFFYSKRSQIVAVLWDVRRIIHFDNL